MVRRSTNNIKFYDYNYYLNANDTHTLHNDGKNDPLLAALFPLACDVLLALGFLAAVAPTDADRDPFSVGSAPSLPLEAE